MLGLILYQKLSPSELPAKLRKNKHAEIILKFSELLFFKRTNSLEQNLMVSKCLATDKLKIPGNWLKIKRSLLTVTSRALNSPSGAVPAIGLPVLYVCVFCHCKSIVALQTLATISTRAKERTF